MNKFFYISSLCAFFFLVFPLLSFLKGIDSFSDFSSSILKPYLTDPTYGIGLALIAVFSAITIIFLLNDGDKPKDDFFIK